MNQTFCRSLTYGHNEMLFLQPSGISVRAGAAGAQIGGISFRDYQLVVARRTIDRRAGQARGSFELLFAIWANKYYVHKRPLGWLLEIYCPVLPTARKISRQSIADLR